MTSRQRRSGESVAWWVDPLRLLLFLIIPFYVFLYLVPSILSRGSLQLRSAIYFNQSYFWLGLAFFAALTIGTAIGRLLVPRPVDSSGRQHDISERYLELLGIFTILAYLIW